MRVRVWASPYIHIMSIPTFWSGDKIAWTKCAIEFAWTDYWPKSGTKPKLPDCPECYRGMAKDIALG